MEIIYKSVGDIIPYANNPRKNDEAVKYVANSIKEFGFKVPIVIDRNNVVVAGHTRLKASKQLGLEKVPCIIADDLSDEQIRAFRIADNSAGQDSFWDLDKLDAELDEIFDFNMSDFGVEFETDTFALLDAVGFDAETAVSKRFDVTLVFPREYEELVKGYIKKRGKADLVELVIKKCMEVENAD